MRQLQRRQQAEAEHGGGADRGARARHARRAHQRRRPCLQAQAVGRARGPQEAVAQSALHRSHLAQHGGVRGSLRQVRPTHRRFCARSRARRAWTL